MDPEVLARFQDFELSSKENDGVDLREGDAYVGMEKAGRSLIGKVVALRTILLGIIIIPFKLYIRVLTRKMFGNEEKLRFKLGKLRIRVSRLNCAIK